MSEEPLRFLCCHGNRRLDGWSLSPALARWLGKNVNVAWSPVAVSFVF